MLKARTRPNRLPSGHDAGRTAKMPAQQTVGVPSLRSDPLPTRGSRPPAERRGGCPTTPAVVSLRRRRYWPLGAAAFLAVFGCAIHDQVQYFSATDPESGETNYYKMTISGWGAGGTDYHMQAGYFSAAAVDVLQATLNVGEEAELALVGDHTVYIKITPQF